MKVYFEHSFAILRYGRISKMMSYGKNRQVTNIYSSHRSSFLKSRGFSTVGRRHLLLSTFMAVTTSLIRRADAQDERDTYFTDANITSHYDYRCNDRAEDRIMNLIVQRCHALLVNLTPSLNYTVIRDDYVSPGMNRPDIGFKILRLVGDLELSIFEDCMDACVKQFENENMWWLLYFSLVILGACTICPLTVYACHRSGVLDFFERLITQVNHYLRQFDEVNPLLTQDTIPAAHVDMWSDSDSSNESDDLESLAGYQLMP